MYRLKIWLSAIPLLLTVLILAAPSPAWAILAETSFEDLVRMSDHIVQAKVQSIRSEWNEDRTQIFTTVTIQVGDVYSGRIADSATVTVVVPGGIVGNLAMEVEHAPVFVVGEEVVLFLTDVDSKSCRVSGWEAGKFTVKAGQVAEKGIPLPQFEKQLDAAIKSVGPR